jgi:hypothetical protein
VQIEIMNTTHRFSPDADESGVNVKYQPIFGSKVYIDSVLIAFNNKYNYYSISSSKNKK